MSTIATEPNAAKQGAYIGMLSILLALYYHVTNPYWYGDAIWYALDVASGAGRLPVESGHLFWRPLGYLVWRFLHAVGVAADPLEVLRVLSSCATALLCIATWRVGAALTGSQAQGLAAAAVVAASKMCLAYGGSGSSYTAAMAFSTLAFLPVVRARKGGWGVGDAVTACFAMTAAWASWGTAVLVLPGLFVAAAVRGDRGLVLRVMRAGALCAAAGCAIALLAFGTWAVLGDTLGGAGFIEWLRASGHGRPMSFVGIGAARAVYGTLVAFVHLGATGTILKSLFHEGQISPAVIGATIVVLGLVTLAAAVGVAFARRMRGAVGDSDARRTRELAAVALATALPVAAFAIVWKGSDVERLSLAMPMLAIVAVHGLASARALVAFAGASEARPGLILAALLALVNLATYVVPTLASGGGLPMALGRVASEHLPASSILVVAGNEIMAEPMGPAFYFHRIRVYSVTWDVIDKGVPAYEQRLNDAIHRALDGGGRVAVLSDLIGEPTLGGIGLDPREHPRPSLAELASVFAGWTSSGSFAVEQYRFVVLESPTTSDSTLGKVSVRSGN